MFLLLSCLLILAVEEAVIILYLSRVIEIELPVFAVLL